MTSREIMMLLLELDDVCRKERATLCPFQESQGLCLGENHLDICPLESLRRDRVALSQKLDGAL